MAVKMERESDSPTVSSFLWPQELGSYVNQGTSVKWHSDHNSCSLGTRMWKYSAFYRTRRSRGSSGWTVLKSGNLKIRHRNWQTTCITPASSRRRRELVAASTAGTSFMTTTWPDRKRRWKSWRWRLERYRTCKAPVTPPPPEYHNTWFSIQANGCPAAQPTVSKHWSENRHSDRTIDTCIKSAAVSLTAPYKSETSQTDAVTTSEQPVRRYRNTRGRRRLLPRCVDSVHTSAFSITQHTTNLLYHPFVKKKFAKITMKQFISLNYYAEPGVLASEGWWEAWQPSPKVTRSY